MIGRKKKGFSSDIVRDSVNTFGTNLFGTILVLISTFLVLNRMGPSVLAYQTQMQFWGSNFSTIIGLSVTSAVVYFVAKYTIKNAKAAVVRLTVWISISIVIIGTVTLALMRTTHTFQTTPTSFLFATVLYGLCSFLFNICTFVLRGENKFKSYNLVILIQRLLAFLVSIAVFLHPSAALYVWATVAINVVMILVAVWAIGRWNGPKPVPAPDDDRPVKTGEMVNYSLKSHVSNVLTFLNTNFGGYIVQGIYTIGDYGIYSEANTAMQQIWLLPDAVSQVILSRLAAMKDQKDKLKIALLSCKLMTYLTTVGALLLLWAAQLLIPVIFPKYIGCIPLMRYLAVGFVIMSYVKILGNSIAAYGRPELNILPTAVGVGTNIVFTLLLFPRMGIYGVATASSISMSLQSVCCMVIFCMFTHTPAYRLLIPNREEIASVRSIFKK